MSFTLRELLLHYIGLLAIFSPVAAISPFMDLTSQYPRKIQLKIAFRASLFAFSFC